MSYLKVLKKLASVLVTLLLVGGVISTNAAQTQIFNITFSETNPLSGWTTMNVGESYGAYLNYVSNPRDPSGVDKCLNFNIQRATGQQPFIQRDGIALMGEGDLEFELRINNSNTPSTPSKPFEKINTLLSMRGDANTDFEFIDFDEQGNVLGYRNGSLVNLGVTIQNNVAFKVKVALNVPNKTYDIYINNNLANTSPLTFCKDKDYPSGIQRIRMIMGSNIGGYDFYLDDLKMTSRTTMDVISTSPTTDTPVTGSFDIVFNSTPDAAKITQDNVQLTQNGEVVLCSLNVVGNAIRISFGVKLSYQTNYTIVLKNISDIDGSVMPDKTITFTTMQKPPMSCSIIGYPMVYQNLSISHTIEDDILSYSWLSASSADGAFTQISGATGQTYFLTETDTGNYIKLKITIVDGTEIVSAPIGPVKSNSNIALGAVANANSFITNFPASNMFDGNLTTRWATNTVNNSWVTFDLGAKATFNKFVMTEFDGRLKSYKLQYSDDSLIWNDAYDVTGVARGTYGQVTTQTFQPVSGRYIKLLITEAYDGPTIYELALYNDISVSPIITNVALNGPPDVGATLTAECEYVSDTSKQASITYEWQISSSKGGPYLPISGAANNKYMIKRKDFGRYIKVKINVTYTSTGSISASLTTNAVGPVGPAKPQAPYVDGLTLTGVPFVGQTVNCTYTYDDINDDVEDGTIYRWLISADSISGNWEEVLRGNRTANEGGSYTIKDSDVDKFIICEIIPVNRGEPSTGEPKRSIPVKVRDVPRAEDVKIIGSYAGKPISGNYTYIHPNGDEESGSTFVWLISSSPDGNFTAIPGATGKTYTPSGSDVGKYIIFEVTPKTQQEPREGKAVRSAPTLIKKEQTGGSSGGGGGPHNQPVKANISSDIIDSRIPEKKTFSDIQNHWAKAEIEYLANMGVIKGVTEGTFEPDRMITRAELTSLVVHAFGISGGDKQVEFNDINKDDWFSAEVAAAARAGIITGSDGSFRPLQKITREEFAKIAMEVYWLKKQLRMENAPPTEFADAGEISPWALMYVNNCIKLELMMGVSEDCFDPKGAVTRAQAAIVIKRLISML